MSSRYRQKTINHLVCYSFVLGFCAAILLDLAIAWCIAFIKWVL